MDPWRRIVGGDTTSKDYQQGEIFESAVLDEGQEFGNSTWLPSLWLAKQMFTRQKNGFYANLRAKIVKGHRKVKLDLYSRPKAFM